jgi:hypothetical protein
MRARWWETHTTISPYSTVDRCDDDADAEWFQYLIERLAKTERQCDIIRVYLDGRALSFESTYDADGTRLSRIWRDGEPDMPWHYVNAAQKAFDKVAQADLLDDE